LVYPAVMGERRPGTITPGDRAALIRFDMRRFRGGAAEGGDDTAAQTAFVNLLFDIAA
jgi:hypothetical protein